MLLRLRPESAVLEVVPEFLQEKWSLRRYYLRLRSGRISLRGDKGVFICQNVKFIVQQKVDDEYFSKVIYTCINLSKLLNHQSAPRPV